MVEIHAGFEKTAGLRSVAQTEFLADATKPGVFGVAAMVDEEMVNVKEAGGLTEMGGEIFEGVLEGGGGGLGQEVVLDKAGEAFFGGEIVGRFGDVVKFAIDRANNMDEFVIGDTFEGEELEVKVFTEVEDVMFVVGATLKAVLVDDFDFVIDT